MQSSQSVDIRTAFLYVIGDLVWNETVCRVGGEVKHLSKLSTTRSIR